MKVGDIVFYLDAVQKDYAVVKDTKDFHWAYWVKEEKLLTFSPSMSCYHFVGPSVLGKW